jgi:hypothetical protein
MVVIVQENQEFHLSTPKRKFNVFLDGISFGANTFLKQTSFVTISNVELITMGKKKINYG